MDQENTLEQLEDKRSDIEFRLADIKGQIEKANAHQKVTGEFADADWYRRANAARRYAAIEHQNILRDIAAFRRSQRQIASATFESSFIESARELLDASDFTMVFKDASRKCKG